MFLKMYWGSLILICVIINLITPVLTSQPNQLYTCGKNDVGQLGQGNEIDSNVPILIPVENPEKLGVGSSHVLVLDADGDVYSFGSNDYLQLGYYTGSDQLTPKLVNFSMKVTNVFAAGSSSFVLLENGCLYGFGANGYGQLGIGTRDTPGEPTIVDFGKNITIVKVSTFVFHTLVLDDNGTLYGFGVAANDVLKLNLNTTIPIVVDYDVVDMAVGIDHFVIVKADGNVVGLGSNIYGQLGRGDTDTECESLCVIPVNTSIVSVETGIDSTLLLDEHGDVYGFGVNSKYQLGIIGDTFVYDPTIINVSDIVSMRCHRNNIMMIDKNDTVIVFGTSPSGGLCLDEIITQPTPTGNPLVFGHHISYYDVGYDTTYIIYVNLSLSLHTSSEETTSESHTSREETSIESFTSSIKSTYEQRTSYEGSTTEILMSDTTSGTFSEVKDSTIGESVTSSVSNTGVDDEIVDENHEGVIEESNNHVNFNGNYNITNITVIESTVIIAESYIDIANIITYQTKVNMDNSNILVDQSAIFDSSSIVLTNSSIVVNGDMIVSNSDIQFEDGSAIKINGCLVIEESTNIVVNANGRRSETLVDYNCIIGNISNLNISVYNLDNNCQPELVITDSSLSTVFLCEATRGNWYIYVIVGSIIALLLVFVVYATIKYRNRVTESMNIIQKRQKDANDKSLVMDSLNNLKAEISITKDQVKDLEDLVNENQLLSTLSSN
eukprot:TRINITY_DN7975_c0_g1_i2.p1 TRINITY_DN7975_c0_g1~~TRINITY_DN7975_c0_g1_i2.p1  ORF type:complete len:722 (-),score=138.78 TRINITY_DN7975_c0_g1_i2:117-2282(-)